MCSCSFLEVACIKCAPVYGCLNQNCQVITFLQVGLCVIMPSFFQKTIVSHSFKVSLESRIWLWSISSCFVYEANVGDSTSAISASSRVLCSIPSSAWCPSQDPSRGQKLIFVGFLNLTTYSSYPDPTPKTCPLLEELFEDTISCFISAKHCQ